MHQIKSIFLIVFLICSLSLAGQMITPKQMIFKSTQPLENIRSGRTGLVAFDSYLNSLGATNLRPITGMHQPTYFLADIETEPDWDAVKNGLMSFAGIEYIQPNHLSKMHLEPNDPRYPEQYHYVVSLPQAWNITTGSELVLVGVVDSGVLPDHPDLAANLYINPHEIPDNGIDDDGNGYIDDWCGWDFSDAPEMADIAIGDYTDQDNDVTDENFHGTHVSGIIGAVGNNGIGISGVCWNVKILPVRAGFRTTQGEGYLQDDDAAAAVIYAADMGCHVINMSWGDDNYSPIIGDACQYAYEKGSVLVASAGNNPVPRLNYPARLSTVISVGAINRNRNLAGFSSYGADLDLVAPGEAILSTYKNTPGELYFEMNGTSMSAPYVTGAIALLLSLHPGLNPEEVRARLLNSTDDLGDPGFDIRFGHGLLNVRKLLESVNPPLISIQSPIEQQAITGSFDITGTITAPDFFRYSVMYASKSNPATILDWRDVETHENRKNYKFDPVINGVLAQFYMQDLQAEGLYLIRVQYEDREGNVYNEYVNIRYDNTPPILRPNSVQGHSRYDNQDLRYYATAVFDESVQSRLKIISSDGSISYCYSALADSIQIWALPSSLPEGQIKIQISAVNGAGLSFTSGEFNNFLNIKYDFIPSHGYSHEVIGPARIPLKRMYDFDGDGVMEYIAMDLPVSGYGNVKVYQPEQGGHIIKHDYQENFQLLDLGNTDARGEELLYLKGDTVYLKETQQGHIYPNLDIWQEPSISGGVIADYSGDGIKDILLIKNLPTERVIQAYKRGSGVNIIAKNILHNPTSTSIRNTFVPTIIVEDLDGDSYPDILTADTDGDVMIFEIRNDMDATLSWHTAMPVANTYTLTAGDYDADGCKDFFVGGYNTDILNPDRSFWYFEGFKNTGNNQYASLGSMFFNNVMTQNAIHSMDLDGDGKDEIILGIPPNLYIVKYIDGKFKPIFRGSSSRSYQILGYRDANNKPFFATNYAIGDSTVFVEWSADTPFTGPPAPANLSVTPISESSANLTWKDMGADYYRIYRKDEEENLAMIDHVYQNSYTDTQLSSGKVYSYAVSAVDSTFTPSESMPGSWRSVIPLPAPQLESLQMVSAYELKLIFDQKLHQNALNSSRYELSHDMGIPHAINSIAQQRGLLLRFGKPFPQIDDLFTLQLNNITGMTGVPIAQPSLQFPYAPDVEAPRVDSTVLASDHKSVRILFSESISPSPDPCYLGNYTLITPANDPENRITSSLHQDDAITINFLTPLKYSNQPYQMLIENIQDLAGNTISPQHRNVRIALMDTKDLKALKVFPNPIRISKQNWVAIYNFPLNKKGQIRIYNNSGDLVHSSPLGPYKMELNNNIWRWNLKTESGRFVSSGVYFYVVEMGGETARGKFAIIH